MDGGEVVGGEVMGGEVVGGYVLGEGLGGGADTWVRRARRLTWPGGEVAVKGVRPGAGAAASGRLRREAELLAASDHPNLVRLLDVVEAGGEACLVLPLAVGGSLAARVRRDGPLAPPAAVDLVLDVAAAVASLERRGHVHGDLKPGNVLLTLDGRPVVADLGSAAALGTAVAGGGSGAFAAPELAPGVPAAPSQDVYSLGMLLSSLVTGSARPGAGSVADRAASRQLATVAATASAAAPEDRYPNAAVFWAALAGCPEAGRQAGGRLGPA